MKLQDINIIIEDTISNEIKSRILQEQEVGIGNMESVQSLESLSPFEGKITNVENTDNNGVTVTIAGITEKELMGCCQTGSVDEALKQLNKNIHNEILKKGMGKNSDVDIDMNTDGKSINMIIKVSPNKGGETEEIDEKMMNPYFVTQEQEKPCDECGEQMESELSGVNSPDEYGHNDQEAEGLMETKKGKKVIRLTEEKFLQMINKIMAEAKNPKVVGEVPKVTVKTKPYKDATKSEMKEIVDGGASRSIPGLQAVKSAHEGDAKDAKEYMSSVDKKMKDYLSFEGNDNPEFPKAIGKGEKAVFNDKTQPEEEYIDTYRGMKPQDAAYDTEPSKDFVDRVRKALEGDSTMGNSQGKDTGNVVKSDVGKKVFKNIKTKRDNIENDPMYVKDSQPTSNAGKPNKAMANDMRFVAAEDTEKRKVIEEEMKRMKEILTYGKKTQ